MLQLVLLLLELRLEDLDLALEVGVAIDDLGQQVQLPGAQNMIGQRRGGEGWQSVTRAQKQAPYSWQGTACLD